MVAELQRFLLQASMCCRMARHAATSSISTTALSPSGALKSSRYSHSLLCLGIAVDDLANIRLASSSHVACKSQASASDCRSRTSCATWWCRARRTRCPAVRWRWTSSPTSTLPARSPTSRYAAGPLLKRFPGSWSISKAAHFATVLIWARLNPGLRAERLDHHPPPLCGRLPRQAVHLARAVAEHQAVRV